MERVRRRMARSYAKGDCLHLLRQDARHPPLFNHRGGTGTVKIYTVPNVDNHLGRGDGSVAALRHKERLGRVTPCVAQAGTAIESKASRSSHEAAPPPPLPPLVPIVVPPGVVAPPPDVGGGARGAVTVVTTVAVLS